MSSCVQLAILPVLSIVSKNSCKGIALSVPAHFGTNANSYKSLVTGFLVLAALENSAPLAAT